MVSVSSSYTMADQGLKFQSPRDWESVATFGPNQPHHKHTSKIDGGLSPFVNRIVSPDSLISFLSLYWLIFYHPSMTMSVGAGADQTTASLAGPGGGNDLSDPSNLSRHT